MGSLNTCTFCRIAEGLVPAAIVYQDERLVAFLDIHPVREGHVQTIPREHYAGFDDLPPETAASIMALGQRVAKALKRLYRVKRVAFVFTAATLPMFMRISSHWSRKPTSHQGAISSNCISPSRRCRGQAPTNSRRLLQG